MSYADIVAAAFSRRPRRGEPAGRSGPTPQRSGDGLAETLAEALGNLSAARDRAAAAQMREYQRVLGVLAGTNPPRKDAAAEGGAP